jgi:hypothetical protein
VKRGAIELPVVMIFTIVAGSLILLFFVVLVQQQGSSSGKSIEASSLQRLDTLLTSAGTARETENNITVSEESLFFECNADTGTRLYYESGIATPVFNQILFSPGELGGGQLRTYSKGTRAGYRVTTILYLSTAATIIQNATPLYDYPGNFPSKSITNPEGASPRWRAVVSAAQYASSPSASDLRKHPDVVVVNEDPLGTHGTVQYYNSGALKGTVVYPNHELLYGAVLSKDADTYNCVFGKYLKQLRWMNSIEQERLLKLKAENAESACYAYYQEFPYSDIESLPTDPLQFTEQSAKKLYEASSQIERMNDALIRGGGGASCAWLY